MFNLCKHVLCLEYEKTCKLKEFCLKSTEESSGVQGSPRKLTQDRPPYFSLSTTVNSVLKSVIFRTFIRCMFYQIEHNCRTSNWEIIDPKNRRTAINIIQCLMYKSSGPILENIYFFRPPTRALHLILTEGKCSEKLIFFSEGGVSQIFQNQTLMRSKTKTTQDIFRLLAWKKHYWRLNL